MRDLFLDGSLIIDSLWQPTTCLIIAITLASVFYKQIARAHITVLLLITAAVFTPMLSAAFRMQGLGFITPATATDPSITSLSVNALQFQPNFLGSAANLDLIFAILWAFLSIIMLFKLARSAQQSRRFINASSPIDNSVFQILALEAAEKLKLQCVPQIYTNSTVRCPVIWCWSKSPKIIIPQHIADSNQPNELFGVFCHELAHYKRKDHWWTLLSEILACALPWHPLIWIAKRRLAQLSEQACDCWAIQAGQSPTTFAKSLLNLIPQRQEKLALAAVTDKRSLVRRIRCILDNRSMNPRCGIAWVLLLSFSAITLSTTAALAHRSKQVTNINNSTLPLSAPSFKVTNDDSPFIVRVVPAELDLGVGEPGKPKPGSLWLINTGSKSMNIVRAKVACGCTTLTRFTAGLLGSGESMQVDLTMTAPTKPGEQKTKAVTFFIDGQPPLKVPIHLKASLLDS